MLQDILPLLFLSPVLLLCLLPLSPVLLSPLFPYLPVSPVLPVILSKHWNTWGKVLNKQPTKVNSNNSCYAFSHFTYRRQNTRSLIRSNEPQLHHDHHQLFFSLQNSLPNSSENSKVYNPTNKLSVQRCTWISYWKIVCYLGLSDA